MCSATSKYTKNMIYITPSKCICPLVTILLLEERDEAVLRKYLGAVSYINMKGEKWCSDWNVDVLTCEFHPLACCRRPRNGTRQSDKEELCTQYIRGTVDNSRSLKPVSVWLHLESRNCSHSQIVVISHSNWEFSWIIL